MTRTRRMHNNTENDDQFVVATVETSDETEPTGGPQPVIKDVDHAVEQGARRRERGLGGLRPRELYLPFARTLEATMRAKGVSASDLAAAIWGRATDSRGYSVARNRDRIGHYTAGTSYPAPENLAKIAEVLGVPVEDLNPLPPTPPPVGTIIQGGGNPGPRARALPSSITVSAVDKGRMRLQVDKVVSSELALRIAAMIEATDTPEVANMGPEIGSIINGGKDNDNGDNGNPQTALGG